MRKYYGKFAAHYINDEAAMTLDPTQYSKMKYGSKTVARIYGYDLAEQFNAHILRLLKESNSNPLSSLKDYDMLIAMQSKQVVVVPSPYDFVPTATFAIKDYFITGFNDFLVKYKVNPVQECKVHRSRSYNEDYGEMDAAQRAKAISSDGFYIDKEFLRGKFVIFLDDIRITGGHEARMEQMISTLDLDCDYMYLYYAELTNVNTNPKIENYLNHFAIKDLWDIDNIVKNEEFLFNTRVIKYILSASEVEFCLFITSQSEVFRRTLYFYLVGNRYHELEQFKVNVDHLKNQTYINFVKSLSIKP